MKHGKAFSPEYRIWSGMVTRCTNPRQACFERYGGRGIQVCERWRSFAYFYADMGPRPSPAHQLDRIDNNGRYEPGNCRWATRAEQHENRRDNRKLEYAGQLLTISEWGRRTDMCHSKIQKRIQYGWTVAQALGFEPRPKRPPRPRDASGRFSEAQA